MKKALILVCAGLSVILLSNCHSSRKAVAAVPKSTFDADFKTLVATNCANCHIAGKGNKKPYDNYANAKEDIDDIIRRIQLNPGDRGFMPKNKPRLSDSTIMAFKKWKADGLLEK